MNTQPIGVLDSGVGGLSIWKEIVTFLPNESTIYVGDSKNCPYGSRSASEIYVLASKLVQFLIKQNVKLIIVACNTITVSCLPRLRNDFPNVPIIGTVPVVKSGVSQSKKKRIGILSTVATAGSEYQKELIRKFAKGARVISLGTDRLVPFVEKGEIESPRMQKLLREELRPFIDAEIDVLALGCSHFPFLKNEMQRILGRDVLILDSGVAITRQVRRVLESNKILSNSVPAYEFYTTGDAKEFQLLTKNLVGNRFADKIQKVKRVVL